MHGKSKQAGCQIDARVERLVVLQVAGVFCGRQREQLHGLLNDLGARRVNEAIKSLEAVGVVVVNGVSLDMIFKISDGLGIRTSELLDTAHVQGFLHPGEKGVRNPHSSASVWGK